MKMNEGRIKILHITPHLGGGVGRVLLNYLIKVNDDHLFKHQVACLDYANDYALAAAKNIGLKVVDKLLKDKERLIEMIFEADIVLMHWWNHPLLYDFLVRVTLPPCRLIIWSHISGFNAPYVFTEKILTYPDLFVFTTPLSHETKEVQNLNDGQKKSLRVIWSTGGVDHVKSIKPQKHVGFNVGYIGTVDYAKLHPHFLNICNKINIPNVKFIVCGGSNEKEIKAEAEAMGIAGKFDFTGLISNINKYLSIFDVFGYPLASYHYGTCDQVLAEAMAAGVVPVVLSNRMEKYMIKDRITGQVAKNEKAYIKAIEELYNDEHLRKKLSRNAIKYAIDNFTLDKLAKEWKTLFEEALVMPKTKKKWLIRKNRRKITATDVFLESLGNYGNQFSDYCSAKSENKKNQALEAIVSLGKSATWQSETKGSVHQYKKIFSNDPYLSTWSKVMK
jgi:glycosyltransferase involved in cell wall biosynthesis